MATAYTPNRRSIMLMAHVYARTGKAGTYAERFAAGLRQSWAEEKAMAAQAAVRSARLQARAALNVRLAADAETSRLAARNTAYSFARGVRTGRFQGGRW